MSLNCLEPSKKQFLVHFSRFQAATYILRVNCAEIIGERPRQPAYELSSIKRRFKQCNRPRRFKESSVRAHQIWVPPENGWFLLLSTNLAQERLQIDTDLLLIITSTADELSGGTNTDDLERHWNKKAAGFSEFFSILGCEAHLKSEFSPKLLELEQDNQRMKLNWTDTVARLMSISSDFLLNALNVVTRKHKHSVNHSKYVFSLRVQ